MGEVPTGVPLSASGSHRNKRMMLRERFASLLAIPKEWAGKTKPKNWEAVVDEINRGGGIYHQIRLRNGLVIKGEYDMTRYLDFYGIPADLSGRTVLDVGTSSGFFAFECARRGASVTAIDLWKGSLFDTLKNALALSAKYVQKSIYDLDASFGRFDIVICTSLLVHLPDVLGALQKIFSVSRDMAIIATAFLDEDVCQSRPHIEFVGEMAKAADDSDYGFYWLMSPVALQRMLSAVGFSRVQEISRFSLGSEPGMNNYNTPHIVFHASR
jgi:2-polyprenyl-3-methyl-5-hydroxy-6-metoxy-1,4-benzoquinol methylase